MSHRSKLDFRDGWREHPKRESLAVGDSGIVALIFVFQIFAVLLGLRFGV
jgi:hypothetical protein